MNFTNRHRLTVLIFGAIFLIFVSVGVVSFAQKDREGFVIEGQSLDGIMIGKSTADDVIAAYGKDYKLIAHNGYSYEMIYKKLGLSFYYCQADTDKEIFVVEMEAPAKITTRKGITLGKSTMGEVWDLYGEWEENSMGFEYGKDGMYFHFEEDTEGEDEEDARREPAPEKNDRPVENPTSAIDGGDNDLVIDEKELLRISGRKTTGVEYSENVEREASEETADEEKSAEKEREELEAIKKKLVRRIDLMEAGGSRQCDSKFSGKKN
jgi:hypothetical protein